MLPPSFQFIISLTCCEVKWHCNVYQWSFEDYITIQNTCQGVSKTFFHWPFAALCLSIISQLQILVKYFFSDGDSFSCVFILSQKLIHTKHRHLQAKSYATTGVVYHEGGNMSSTGDRRRRYCRLHKSNTYCPLLSSSASSLSKAFSAFALIYSLTCWLSWLTCSVIDFNSSRSSAASE